MTPFYITLSLILCTLLTATPVTQRSSICPQLIPYDPPSQQRDSPVSPRIVNGDPISANLQPYVAAIFLRLGSTLQFWCSGTVVAPNWIISAAHCFVTTQEPAAYNVLLGVSRTSEQDQGVLADVVALHPHPNFVSLESSGGYDIAAMQIEYEGSPKIKSMRISVNAAAPAEGEDVRVMGYGITAFGASEDDNVLRQVDVPVYNMSLCTSVYEGFVDKALQVCAGYEEGECDSCQGDSGGPLIQYDDAGEPILAGVVSFGRSCAEPLYPGVYVRVGAFQRFLDQRGVSYQAANIDGESTEDDPPQSAGGGEGGGGGGGLKLSAGVIAAVAICAVVIAILLVVIGIFSHRVFGASHAKSPEAPMDIARDDQAHPVASAGSNVSKVREEVEEAEVERDEGGEQNNSSEQQREELF